VRLPIYAAAVVSTSTSRVVRSRAQAVQGAPLGPGSVLWRVAGDGRSLLTGTAAGLMQLMLPGLGAGVIDHSDFYNDPWGRILRSIPQIWGTIFAADPDEGSSRGKAIRDLHPDIKGVDDQGRRYHALDPDVFWWAHATFTWEFLRAADLFFPLPLVQREKEQLYAESVTWYQRYGVSDRPVPPDLAAFERRFAEICADVLELTPAIEEVLHPRDPKPLPPSRLPSALAFTEPTVLKLRGEVLRLTTIGSLPDIVRRRFDLPWTNRDRARFLALALAIRGLGAAVDSGRFDVLFPPDTPHRPPAA
jgi:uncharacterized protein (DUF2236 family)